jgi:hypothetical protein
MVDAVKRGLTLLELSEIHGIALQTIERWVCYDKLSVDLSDAPKPGACAASNQ